MKHVLSHAAALVLVCLIAGPANAQTAAGADAIAQSRTFSEQKQFDKAEKLLQGALETSPDDLALRLEIARVHSWQGRYDLADGELGKLLKEYPGNSDIRFAQANLLIYRGDRDEAAALLKDILREQPDNREARDTLARLEKAEENVLRWQADAGGEYSEFARQSRSAWNSQFLQLTHFFDDKQTTVYGRVQRYWQFDRTDVQIETGAAYRFSPVADAYALVAYTPGAVFKQKLRLGTGGTLRLGGWDDNRSTLRLTLDLRHDEYAGVAVNEIDPGLRLDFAGGWALSGRAIVVKPGKEDALSGWLVRADVPIMEGWSGFAGAARAPETVAGRTVETVSFFGGANVALTDRLTLRFSYAHEDRERSYIRHVFALSVSQRF